MSVLSRCSALGAVAALGVTLIAPQAAAADLPVVDASPGAPGIGDPYFPTDGNGGYDVRHYELDVTYEPDTDVLTGVATISAVATQNLSSLNLDLDGMKVHSVTVNGKDASSTRDGAELTVKPTKALAKGAKFTAVLKYDGVPKVIDSPELGLGGVITTDDGAVIIGQPHVASTWFPVNDHPLDKATYAIDVTVPSGLEAVSNGVLKAKKSAGGSTTWQWREDEPMASYLATATVGQFDLDSYRKDGIKYWDALDPDLFDEAQPQSGDHYAIAQKDLGGPSYKRLMRTIHVPTGDDATLSFWVTLDTEANWDYAFVEAHTAGVDDWTTLRDLNGHTGQETGSSCPYWLALHPFLEHYETEDGDGCSPTGTTGEWWAASGASDGAEEWMVDLTPYVGDDVEVSITYVSDNSNQGTGVFVDDIDVSTGEGSTSFEADGDPLDGWTVPGEPRGSAPNSNDWIVGTPDDAPATVGDIAAASLARQPEVIDFLEGIAGPYPFSAAGGLVDNSDDVTFALENQTRPIYTKLYFTDETRGAALVVHETAHQWYGDSVAVRHWQHIWMNEGFADYAEWLWSEHEGDDTPQELFDYYYDSLAADDEFWDLRIGDPGPDGLFAGPVYIRGAMTLQQLRVTVGDDDFFHILRRWPQKREGGHSTTQAFISMAERISGEDLGPLFDAWLFTASKPDLAPSRVATVPDRAHPPAAVAAQLDRFRLQGQPILDRTAL